MFRSVAAEIGGERGAGVRFLGEWEAASGEERNIEIQLAEIQNAA